MTRDQFRRLALALPEAIEGSHHEQPDFRVGGRIFASLPKAPPGRATIMLTTAEQDALVSAHPEAFAPVPGGWGRQGATHVVLRDAPAAVVREALELAWRRRAPKRLLRED